MISPQHFQELDIRGFYNLNSSEKFDYLLYLRSNVGEPGEIERLTETLGSEQAHIENLETRIEDVVENLNDLKDRIVAKSITLSAIHSDLSAITNRLSL